MAEKQFTETTWKQHLVTEASKSVEKKISVVVRDWHSGKWEKVVGHLAWKKLVGPLAQQRTCFVACQVDRPSISLSARIANTFLFISFHKDEGRNGNLRTAPYWTRIANVSQSVTCRLNNSLQQKADAPKAHQYGISRESALVAPSSVHTLMQYPGDNGPACSNSANACATPVHYQAGGWLRQCLERSEHIQKEAEER